MINRIAYASGWLCDSMRCALSRFTGAVIALLGALALANEPPPRIDVQSDRLTFIYQGVSLATYVPGDKEILRPYFCQVQSLQGKPLTRTHPPKEGTDPVDHATMHPGVWLAFGDLGGADFWRNKSLVDHVEFVEQPRVLPDQGGFTFRVRNRYRSGERTICEELCRHTLAIRADGWRLEYDSEFTAKDTIAFGDQEEMGLGVRVASPLRVKGGAGRISSDDGSRDEAGIWGRAAKWCDYRGTVDGRDCGLLLMPHPENRWPSRWHVRDYGLMVANPFGRKTFRLDEVNGREITPEKPLRLRFAVFLYDAPAGSPPEAAKLYREYVQAGK